MNDPDRRRPHPGFAVAAVAGGLHAEASLYWAAGGTWLLDTLGTRIVETFAPMAWVLWPVGLVKLAAAVVPAVLDARGRLTRPWRVLCWLGAAVLIGWGGLNTVVANLVLAGVVVPDGAVDRPGLIGHAWLWDPLFLVWGVVLATGLWATARRRVTAP